MPTPCASCPKAGGAGKPNPAADLSAKNWRALQFYWQVKGGMPQPDDVIAQRNGGLIEQTLEAVRRSLADSTPLLALLARR